MSDWTPKSERKLEGNKLVVPGNFEDMRLSDDDLLDTIGERLPGSPRVDDPAFLRPDANLITAPSLVRSIPRSDDELLALSRQCFSTSEQYFNASHRTRIIDAMARFNSEHPKGSKYWGPAFEKRSKLFRPKTRAMVRNREAGGAISMFGSSDILSVRAAQGSQAAALDARMQEELVDFRLQEDDRFYKLFVGGIQDAERQGFAIACTYWDYEESNQYYKENHPQLGQIDRVDTVAHKDRPGWRLVPIERFKFSPASDWMNVVESSPYLIEQIPMFMCDIRKQENNPRAKLKYRHLPAATLMSGGHTGEWDAVRMQRERNRLNRYERQGEPNDYAVCWVHRNIVRIEGEDYVYDTIGNVAMLSDPIPLSEFDPRGYRPYVVGSTLFESHNPFNVGGVTLSGNVQDEINDIANLRVDANKMATSGRMFIKRGTGIDLNALARFAPGAVTEMDNPSQDVKWDRSPEAPRGAFEENQLLSTEMDDLMGGFNQSSVSNNRNLNETVGGMEMTATNASQLTEYDLHTYIKTFVCPFIMQILDLCKMWETDAELAQIIGEKYASSAKQFWKALDRKSSVIVNVGFGATNPQKRIERIGMAFGMTAKMFPQAMQEADQDEVISEIFASAGYSDAARFFPSMDKNAKQDPQVRALQQQVANLQAQLNPIMQKGQLALQLQQQRGQDAIKLEQLRQQFAHQQKVMELQIAYIDLQLKHEQNDIERSKLMLAREELSHKITMERLEFMLQEQTMQQSPNPPNVPMNPDESGTASALNQPGSQLALPPFPQDAATASQYAKDALGGQPKALPALTQD